MNAAAKVPRRGITWANNAGQPLEHGRYFNKNAPVSEEAAAAAAKAEEETAAAAEEAKYTNQPAHAPLSAPPPVPQKYKEYFKVRDLFINYDTLPQSVKEDTLTAHEKDMKQEFRGLLTAFREVRNMTELPQTITLAVYKFFGNHSILQQGATIDLGTLLLLRKSYKGEYGRILRLEGIIRNCHLTNNQALQQFLDIVLEEEDVYIGGKRQVQQQRRKRKTVRRRRQKRKSTQRRRKN